MITKIFSENKRKIAEIKNNNKELLIAFQGGILKGDNLAPIMIGNSIVIIGNGNSAKKYFVDALMIYKNVDSDWVVLFAGNHKYLEEWENEIKGLSTEKVYTISDNNFVHNISQIDLEVIIKNTKFKNYQAIKRSISKWLK